MEEEQLRLLEEARKAEQERLRLAIEVQSLVTLTVISCFLYTKY